MMTIKYACAIVEISPGKFEVTVPSDVETNPYAAIPSPAKYADNDHLNVSGGADASSVEEFRANVSSIVDKLVSSATDDKPLTLDAIKDALPYRSNKMLPKKYHQDALFGRYEALNPKKR